MNITVTSEAPDVRIAVSGRVDTNSAPELTAFVDGLSGELAGQIAALGLLGGEIGARVMGAASWIMLVVQGADVQRALARVFIADTRNRFIRDHLPVSTPVLFAFATLPALAVALVASAAVSAAGLAPRRGGGGGGGFPNTPQAPVLHDPSLGQLNGSGP